MCCRPSRSAKGNASRSTWQRTCLCRLTRTMTCPTTFREAEREEEITMKSKRTKAIAVIAVVALAFASPARAILGLGDVVFDPTNYAQAIKTFIQLQPQHAQLIHIYQQTG